MKTETVEEWASRLSSFFWSSSWSSYLKVVLVNTDPVLKVSSPHRVYKESDATTVPQQSNASPNGYQQWWCLSKCEENVKDITTGTGATGIEDLGKWDQHILNSWQNSHKATDDLYLDVPVAPTQDMLAMAEWRLALKEFKSKAAKYNAYPGLALITLS